jgi:hypothetical protein
MARIPFDYAAAMSRRSSISLVMKATPPGGMSAQSLQHVRAAVAGRPADVHDRRIAELERCIAALAKYHHAHTRVVAERTRNVLELHFGVHVLIPISLKPECPRRRQLSLAGDGRA